MLRKFRIKFILIATVSVALVLIIVLGLVNFVTYRNATSEIYTTMEFISENSDVLVNNDVIVPQGGKDSISLDTQYAARYFLVDIDNKKSIVAFNLDHISDIGEDELSNVLTIVDGKYFDRGVFGYEVRYYAYIKKTTDDGNLTRYIIMDCTRSISTVNFLKRFSVIVGLLSVFLLLLILMVFSRKAISPYIKNAEAQKQFITNASHELKTPLAVISANTEVIELTGGKNEWTESTIKQVNRMSELISQLVVLSRLEEREDIVLTDVDISSEATEVSESFKTVAETQNKSLVANVEPDIHVLGDQKGVHELINILADNAVKYCDDGGEVGIRLTKKGRNVFLVVSNNFKDGGGIDYKRFFDRFYREDQSHNSEKKGYGIGLSMADSIVRILKGKITASWKKGVIYFTVTLSAVREEKEKGITEVLKGKAVKKQTSEKDASKEKEASEEEKN